jgi:amino acid transporter
MILDYILQVMSLNIHAATRFFLLAGTSIALAYVNWLGLALVGNMSMVVCFISMSPFLILVVVGAFQCDPSRWLTMPQNYTEVMEYTDDDITGGFLPNALLGGILWRPFLNNLFWNLNSFDSAASWSADVDDIGKTLPRAMGWAFVMMFASYILPLLVVMGASDAVQSDWEDGYLAKAAEDIGGPWLGGWTVMAAAISNIALFQAELSADAFQLMGMAERGHVPKIFAHRSRHGTPTYGILLGTCVIVIMGTANLDALIEMLNFNYAIALLMEYAAFIKLRISQPDRPRPYRVPLNTFGCFVCILPTIFFIVLVMVLADYRMYVFITVVLTVGVLAYCYMAVPGEKRAECWQKFPCSRYSLVSVVEAAAASVAGPPPPPMELSQAPLDYSKGEHTLLKCPRVSPPYQATEEKVPESDFQMTPISDTARKRYIT